MDLFLIGIAVVSDRYTVICRKHNDRYNYSNNLLLSAVGSTGSRMVTADAFILKGSLTWKKGSLAALPDSYDMIYPD
jgi:hypothetical protein